MNRIILGIESSCDETAAAIYTTERGVLANSISSQIKSHSMYGGVVPEIASAQHLPVVQAIVQQALATAGITIQDVDAIAVTNKPGLPGSLLVGMSFAKGIAYGADKPIIGINHLEGHIFSACLEHKVEFPTLCITASGGHTAMYLVEGYGDYRLISQTRDDAAGEAFDKIAKLLNIPYPGGPIIEQLAATTAFTDYFAYPRGKKDMIDFSFSGLKTAVLYDLIDRGWYNKEEKRFTALQPTAKAQVASSLLCAISDIICAKATLALKSHANVRSICFVGGVACNTFIAKQLTTVATQHGLSLYVPSKQYCTDNAAMIAFVGHYKLQQGLIDSLALDIL